MPTVYWLRLSISIPIAGPLRPARFVDRPNRFLVRVRLDLDDLLVTAHLADPGRLRELLIPNARIWVREEQDHHRRTRWTAVTLEHPTAGLISLDTLLPNQLAARAIEKQGIDALDGWYLQKREVTVGRSRFDFLLERLAGEQMILEVKSVTMAEDGIAYFPDAPTERGARHVHELCEFPGRPGWSSTLLFLIQRVDVERLRPAVHIDPEFAQALSEAARAGVRILAYRCQVTLEELVLGKSVPVDFPRTRASSAH